MGRNISGVWRLLGGKKMAPQVKTGRSPTDKTVRWLEKPKW